MVEVINSSVWMCVCVSGYLLLLPVSVLVKVRGNLSTSGASASGALAREFKGLTVVADRPCSLRKLVKAYDCAAVATLHSQMYNKDCQRLLSVYKRTEEGWRVDLHNTRKERRGWH